MSRLGLVSATFLFCVLCCIFSSYIRTYLGERRRPPQGLKQQWRKPKSSARNKTTKITLSWLVRGGFSPFHVRLCLVISTMCLLQDPKGTRRVKELGRGQHARSRSNKPNDYDTFVCMCIHIVCACNMYVCMYVCMQYVCSMFILLLLSNLNFEYK